MYFGLAATILWGMCVLMIGFCHLTDSIIAGIHAIVTIAALRDLLSVAFVSSADDFEVGLIVGGGLTHSRQSSSLRP
jgi:hypothetical protein